MGNDNHNKQNASKGRKNGPNKRSKGSKLSSGQSETSIATLSIEGSVTVADGEQWALMSVIQDQDRNIKFDSLSTLNKTLNFKNKNLAVRINMAGMKVSVTDKNFNLGNTNEKPTTSVRKETMKKGYREPEKSSQSTFSLPLYCSQFVSQTYYEAIAAYDLLTVENAAETSTVNLGNAKCLVCGNSAKHTCLKCSKILDFCEKHQEYHVEACYPAEEMSRDDCMTSGALGKGPYLKATMDLIAREMIYEDQPLMTGPGCVSDHDYSPFCLGCSDRVKPMQKCILCKWPFCGPQCPAGSLHTKNECVVFRINHVQELFDPFQYELVRILRCVLAKQRSPEKYEKLLKLDGALEERKKNDDLKEATKTACMFIRQNCNLKRVDVQTINKICGIVHLQTLVSGKHDSSMHIYSFPSKLSHSCLPNTRVIDVLQPNGEHRIKVVALKSIKKGEPLTISLTDQMKPNFLRDMYMKENYYYKCSCTLCLDASEAGAHFSSLVCWKCKRSGWSDTDACFEEAGYISPATPKMGDVWTWTCSRCDWKLNENDVTNIMDFQASDQSEFLEELRQLDTKKQICKLNQKIIEQCKKLHPNNYYVWEYRRILISLLIQNMIYMAQPASYNDFRSIWNAVERQLYFVLQVLDKLQPDPTVIRGQIMCEVARALWAFIEWEVVFEKAESFEKHKDADTFDNLVGYVTDILKSEVTSVSKSLLMDLNFMNDNRGLTKQRVGLMRLVNDVVEMKINDDDDL